MPKADHLIDPTKNQPKNWLRDVVLGGQDGLVNALGIVLGVTAASGDVRLIIAASLAAGFAEAVSMGAVAYTSASTERDRYHKELLNEHSEIDQNPEEEKDEVRQIYKSKGFDGKLLEDIVDKITSDKKVWANTMMSEELNLTPLDTETLLKSSFIVGLAALIGAVIPIVPFFLFPQNLATASSLSISALALFCVGYYEAKKFVGTPWKNGLQMVLIGMGAALVGFVIGKIFHAN